MPTLKNRDLFYLFTTGFILVGIAQCLTFLLAFWACECVVSGSRTIIVSWYSASIGWMMADG